MNQVIKKNIKDPKIITIVTLLTLMGVENSENIAGVVTSVVSPVQENNDREPEVVISYGDPSIVGGTVEAEEGDLIHFSSVESYGEHFTWDVSPHLEMESTTDGRDCYFGSKPGNYTITLFVSNCKGQSYEKQELIITSTDDCPDVPVVPSDPGPAGLSGLAKDAHDLAMSSVDAKWLKNAATVAKVYESLSGSTKYKNPQSFVSQTLIEIRKALGADVKGWAAWYTAMAIELQKEVSSGKLVTIAQYQAAWKQIAEGLDSI